MATREIKKLRSKNKRSKTVPTLVVYRSNKNIQVQLLDPQTGRTLFTFNSNKITKGTKVEKAEEVGKKAAEALKQQKIEKVVFDRSGYVYHGRVQALVDSIRNNQIEI